MNLGRDFEEAQARGDFLSMERIFRQGCRRQQLRLFLAIYASSILSAFFLLLGLAGLYASIGARWIVWGNLVAGSTGMVASAIFVWLLGESVRVEEKYKTPDEYMKERYGEIP